MGVSAGGFAVAVGESVAWGVAAGLKVGVGASESVASGVWVAVGAGDGRRVGSGATTFAVLGRVWVKA